MIHTCFTVMSLYNCHGHGHTKYDMLVHYRAKISDIHIQWPFSVE